MKLVLCAGCFDLLHYGHILHLRAARSLGDLLIVALSSDENVARKGPGRPRFTWDQRRDMLTELRCVDGVVFYNDYNDLIDGIIKVMRPSIYVKGSDYKGNLPEQQLIESLGGAVVFTETPKWSSTKLMGGS